MIGGIALIVATLALTVSLGHLVADLLKRDKYQHGPEVEDLDATFERAAAQNAWHQRRPEMSDDTVPLLHPGEVNAARDRRRG